MKTKHTTGLWTFSKQDSNMYSIDGSRSTPVAMINPFNRDWLSEDEIEANAKLIASAPELLKSLELAWSLLIKDEVQNTGVIRRAWNNTLMDQISNTIKKATE